MLTDKLEMSNKEIVNFRSNMAKVITNTLSEEERKIRLFLKLESESTYRKILERHGGVNPILINFKVKIL